LLTGHHRDDQIETHLIRHRARSGVDGLAGMSAIRELGDCRVLRPLLGVARDRLAAFLQSEKQPFISDPSNLDPAFERSRYRRGEAATAGGKNAVRLAAEIRGLGLMRTAREREANARLASCVSVHPAGFAVLDPGIVSASDEVVQRLLSGVVMTIGGLSYPPRREQIARLREVLAANGPRGHTLGGCRFVRWRGRVLALRELGHAAEPMRLTPGETTRWDDRFQITVPPDMDGSLTIGYTGAADVAKLHRLTPGPRQGRPPRLILPIFPVVWDTEGIAAVPHLGYRREQAGALPQVVFRPVNPLTQAGFAVV
jgi:tRNA(Ile)-lysidine synthase